MSPPPNMLPMHRASSSTQFTEVLAVDQSAIHFTPSPPHLHPFDSPSLTIDCSTTREHLERAASVLKKEENPVAFPTETVYGLGADATNDEAVKKIFKAKNRPSDNPLIVHVASLQQLRDLLKLSSDPTPEVCEDGLMGGEGSSGRNSSLAGSPRSPAVNQTCSSHITGKKQTTEEPTSMGGIPDVYFPLIEKFWPGPLTILLDLPRDTPLSRNVTAEQTTFAVRIPDHPIALALAYITNLPIAAPSANASGKPSPTTAAHVYNDLHGRIPLILDGGSSNVGLESTVVSGLCSPPRVLRPGGISIEQIRTCGGVWANCLSSPSQDVEGSRAEEEYIPLVPGMKYKHYSPRARVFLYEPGAKPPSAGELARSVRWNGKVGILRTRTWKSGIGNQLMVELEAEKIRHRTEGSLGRRGSVLTERELSGVMGVVERCLGTEGADISRALFGSLRELDDLNVDTIHVEGITEDHEGLAVMNRLRKAASVVVRNVSYVS